MLERDSELIVSSPLLPLNENMDTSSLAQCQLALTNGSPFPLPSPSEISTLALRDRIAATLASGVVCRKQVVVATGSVNALGLFDEVLPSSGMFGQDVVVRRPNVAANPTFAHTASTIGYVIFATVGQ